jgi:hypothetical protein
MVSELDELRGAVELHGTSRQRADFLHHEVLTRFRRERFVVSDETLALALRGLELQQQDGDILSLAILIFLSAWRAFVALNLTKRKRNYRLH